MRRQERCNEKIETIEKKILVLSGEETGEEAGAEDEKDELHF